jgi:lysophospholipase L1-like esterase
MLDKECAWYRLKPDSEGRLFENRIRINHLGFRGREITADKGAAYRIVALGESTTFGYTFEAGDRPWPEVLEQLIAERLKPGRPVEVINAGIPGFNLAMNVRRLENEILRLRPDMIISYHGFNGFTGSNLLASSRSRVRGAPAYQNRPTRLLADCEYSLKLTLYKRQQRAAHRPAPLTVPDPLNTGYATAYRRLIELAQTNGIRLVIGNYSMAANQQSQPDVIEFYDRRFPGVGWYIKANEIHSEILRRLAPQYADVTFVDTHPSLDGEYVRFSDLVHLTQEGRQQLAEVFYAGVERILKQDLDHKTAGQGNETR